MSDVNIQGMYAWAVRWCNTADVQYSQAYRNFQTIDGITYFDCSSFTFFACWLGGGLDVAALGYSTNLQAYQERIPLPPDNRPPNAWTVSSMERALSQLSGWRFMAASDPQPGDILVRHNAHCEIVYSSSPAMSMGARNPGELPEDQVAIHYTTWSSWDGLWRQTDSPGPHPGPYQPVPIWLLRRAQIINRGGLI